MSELKDLREKFGVTKAPIPATRVYRKAMDFDHDGREGTRKIDTVTWILVNDLTGNRTHANSYDAKLGTKYDPTKNTHSMPKGEKDARRVLKGYEQVDIKDCPFAVLAVATDVTEAPKAEATPAGTPA